jgi:hypothetical protein
MLGAHARSKVWWMKGLSCLLILSAALAGCGGQTSTNPKPALTTIRTIPIPHAPHYSYKVFTGIVAEDACANRTTSAPVGDIGCGLIVDDNTVEIVHGNILYPNGWGTVRGFSPTGENIVGSTVEVDARYRGPHAYDLGCPRCFVKLLH